MRGQSRQLKAHNDSFGFPVERNWVELDSQGGCPCLSQPKSSRTRKDNPKEGIFRFFRIGSKGSKALIFFLGCGLSYIARSQLYGAFPCCDETNSPPFPFERLKD
ncbi:hypothetical protein M5K25_014695 [Dendrobium thyrsiflorum]|uniref:Uncharacterized protein n=1 Tax=Dendrobium thyrsiflorum TaxID=117978 RepID=A0ABD0UVD1_DENTH